MTPLSRGSLSKALGKGSLSREVSVHGDFCPGGLCQGDLPPYGKEQAVRILLECILVLYSLWTYLEAMSLSLLRQYKRTLSRSPSYLVTVRSAINSNFFKLNSIQVCYLEESQPALLTRIVLFPEEHSLTAGLDHRFKTKQININKPDRMPVIRERNFRHKRSCTRAFRLQWSGRTFAEILRGSSRLFRRLPVGALRQSVHADSLRVRTEVSLRCDQTEPPVVWVSGFHPVLTRGTVHCNTQYRH